MRVLLADKDVLREGLTETRSSNVVVNFSPERMNSPSLINVLVLIYALVRRPS